MPVNAPPRRTRPNGAPAYYLGRPASLWITAATHRSGTPGVTRQATWASIARPVPRVMRLAAAAPDATAAA